MQFAKRAGAVAAIALSALILQGAAGRVEAQTTIKVVVNGEPITSNEINQRARLLGLFMRGQSAASIQRAAEEELIDDKLKILEAKRVGISISDREIDTAFAGFAQRLKITPAQMAQALAQQGVDASSFKTRLRTQMMWQQLVVGRFRSTINISDAEILDALDKKGDTKDKEKLVKREGTTNEYNLQQVILVVPAQGGNAEARLREAEALRAKANGCDGLQGLVRPLKEAVVKPLGKRTEDELPDVFRGVLADVPIGKLSKPQRTPLGIEMVAVCEKRQISGDFTIRSKVEDELRQKQGELMSRRYLNDLKRIAVINYRR